MKIVIIIPGMEYPGGVERVTSIQANYWIESGHEVVLLIPSTHKKESFYKLHPNINIKCVETPAGASIKIPKLSNYIYFKRLQQNYTECLNILNPDIVITTLQGIDYKVIRSAYPKKPIIGISHISNYLRFGNIFISKRNSQIKKLKEFNAIVNLNMTDTISLKMLGINSIFIPNPCSFDNIEISNLERDKTIICVGRLDYLKGQERLLKSWQFLAHKYPDWKLLLVGDGDMHEDLLRLEKEYGIENNVEHIYNSKDVKSLLMRASIFAFASRTECCSMALIEAASCGLPMLCYDCESGPRDIVNNYFNGFIIPENHIVEFTNKLELLIKNKKLRNEMGKNAYNIAQKFKKEVIMAQWDNLLKQLVK